MRTYIIETIKKALFREERFSLYTHRGYFEDDPQNKTYAGSIEKIVEYAVKQGFEIDILLLPDDFNVVERGRITTMLESQGPKPLEREHDDVQQGPADTDETNTEGQ